MVTPAFSIIIPVLHESAIINDLLFSLQELRCDDEHVEIIVVDGSTNQDTLAVITDKQVIKCSAQQGRGAQMNKGAAQAKGDVLVFLHADTFLPPDGLIKIKTILQTKKYVGGAFSAQVQSKKPLYKMIYAFSNLRSRITQAPYGDQVIFLTSSYFHKIGGYKKIPLMEDVELMRRIKRKGGRICILPDKVVTSPRRFEKEGHLYAALRDSLIIFLYWCGVPAEKLAKFYPQ